MILLDNLIQHNFVTKTNKFNCYIHRTKHKSETVEIAQKLNCIEMQCVPYSMLDYSYSSMGLLISLSVLNTVGTANFEVFQYRTISSTKIT